MDHDPAVRLHRHHWGLDCQPCARSTRRTTQQARRGVTNDGSPCHSAPKCAGGTNRQGSGGVELAPTRRGTGLADNATDSTE